MKFSMFTNQAPMTVNMLQAQKFADKKEQLVQNIYFEYILETFHARNIQIREGLEKILPIQVEGGTATRKT